MRALVTGASGFLGRHIVGRLLVDGFEVTAFDVRPVDHPGARSVEGDLRDAESVVRAIRGHDVVCHVGAIGDVYLAAQDPPLAAAVNVTGTAHVSEASRRAGARVIYASTWEVYGEPRYEPLDEDHPCAPDHPYNITKLAGERLLAAADRLQDVPTLSLRLGTAYGPGLRANSVFRLFIDRARRRQPITIQGDGLQGRQFTHAEDIAAAFSLASRSEQRGLVLNTVAEQSVSIKQLAELVIQRYPTELQFAPARAGDVPTALVSADRIRSVLGWKPSVTFDEGLSRLMDSLENDD